MIVHSKCMDWKKVGWGVLVINILILNVGLGYLIYKNQYSRTNNQINIQEPKFNNQTSDQLKDLEIRIANLEAGSSATPVPTMVSGNKTISKSNTVVPTKTKTRTVSYYTIPGAGTTAGMAWTSLGGTDFYFDPADYPGLVEIYFEANLNLYNGNGKAYVRLYDVTHGIGVQGSEVETALQPATLVTSGRVSFWAGKNLIRVQAKTLTADTTVYNSGRLKIVSEN